MNDKITIVTAFFPLKREEWTGFERSNNKYVSYFKFWARLKNDLIVYTTPDFSDEVRKIRNEFGLKNTKIIEIEDVTKIDEELYTSIEKAASSQVAQKFRLQPKNPECWNALYDYIMILKWWFLKDAVENHNVTGQVAWVDFGVNHGGQFYDDPMQFDDEWKYCFEDKINLFSLYELDDLPIYEVSRRMHTYIQGTIAVMPDHYCNIFWNMCKQNMICLNKVGLIDDDQTIMLMSYRENPEIFKIIYEEKWIKELEDFSNLKLIRKKVEEKSKYRLFREKLHFKKMVIQYLYSWYQELKNDYIKSGKE